MDTIDWPIPYALFVRLSQQAAHLGVSVPQLIEDALESSLAELEAREGLSGLCDA